MVQTSKDGISGLNDVLEVFEGTKYNELYYNAQYQLKKY